MAPQDISPLSSISKLNRHFYFHFSISAFQSGVGTKGAKKSNLIWSSYWKTRGMLVLSIVFLSGLINNCKQEPHIGAVTAALHQ